MKKLFILSGVIFCVVLNLAAAEFTVRSRGFKTMIEAIQKDKDEERAILLVNHFIPYTLL